MPCLQYLPENRKSESRYFCNDKSSAFVVVIVTSFRFGGVCWFGLVLLLFFNSACVSGVLILAPLGFYGWFWLHPHSILNSLPSVPSTLTTLPGKCVTHFKITITTSVCGESQKFSPEFLLNAFLNLNYVHLNQSFCCLLNLCVATDFCEVLLVANLKADLFESSQADFE